MRVSIKQGLILSGIIILIVIIALIIELFSVKYNYRFNLTGNPKYELSGRTKKILHFLKDNIYIIYFGPRDMPETELMEKMLKLYSDCSDKIKWKVVDPKRNVMLVKRYNVSPEEKITVIKYKGKVERIIVSSEDDLTNAILRLTTKKIKVYFLIRDGECNPFKPGDIYTKVLDIIEDENYLVKPLYWKNNNIKIPKDAELIIVWGPKKEFTNNEITAFDSYIKKGGKLLFILEPFTVYSLNKLLNKFNVAIKDDIVVDKSSRLIGGDMFMPMITPSVFGDHIIAKHLGLPVMLPMARSINITGGPAPKECEIKIILKTNPGSWTISKKRYDEWEFDYKKGEGEKGSIPVAVSVKAGKGKMIIIGSADFANNSYIDLPGIDNRWLFMDLVEWLCRGENFISDRPKPYRYSYRSLKESERKRLLYVIIAMPFAVLLTGMAIYLKIKRVRI